MHSQMHRTKLSHKTKLTTPTQYNNNNSNQISTLVSTATTRKNSTSSIISTTQQINNQMPSQSTKQMPKHQRRQMHRQAIINRCRQGLTSNNNSTREVGLTSNPKIKRLLVSIPYRNCPTAHTPRRTGQQMHRQQFTTGNREGTGTRLQTQTQTHR
jgi:hypothetical protein